MDQKIIITRKCGIYDHNSFILAHGFTAAAEGGFSDHPADRGGMTAYGVSVALIRDMRQSMSGRVLLDCVFGQLGDKAAIRAMSDEALIRAMTRERAADIMRAEFWEPHGQLLHPLNALLVYDAAVNHGRKTGALLAQRAWNAWKPAGMGRLAEDGIIGPKTIAALAERREGIEDLYAACRLDHYAAIIRKNPSQKAFEKGWRNRVKNLLSYAAAWYGPDRLEIVE